MRIFSIRPTFSASTRIGSLAREVSASFSQAESRLVNQRKNFKRSGEGDAVDTCLFDRSGSPHTHEMLGFGVRIVGCRARDSQGFKGLGFQG